MHVHVTVAVCYKYKENNTHCSTYCYSLWFEEAISFIGNSITIVWFSVMTVDRSIRVSSKSMSVNREMGQQSVGDQCGIPLLRLFSSQQILMWFYFRKQDEKL